MLILTTVILSALASGPTIPLAGTTVDAKGKPVADAELWLAGLPGPGDAPIVGQGRSDQTGRFALMRPAALAGEGIDRPLTLWAFRPGLRVAWREFSGELPAPDRPVRLELGPPAGTEIRVVNPEEDPVAGARVRAQILHPSVRDLPDPLADRLEMTTDSAGRAVLDAFDSVSLRTIGVRADGFGSQPRTFYPPSDGAKTIRLRPAASVAGRLTPDDLPVVKGWKVSAWTTPADGLKKSYGDWVGHAEAVTNDHGLFRIPAIAAGKLSLSFEPPDDVPYRPKKSPWPVLKAGEENAVEVPVLRAVRVEGVFRDRQTSVPIPGVRINLYSAVNGNRFPVTDARGRFVEYALPDDLHIRAIDTPAPYVATPGTSRHDVKVPDGRDHFDLEPFELVRRGPPLRGIVLDESGRPTAGAIVTGAWSLAEEKWSGIETASTTTGESGRFRLVAIAPGADVKVFARRRDLAMPGPVPARVGQNEPVTLRLSRAATASICGRVVRKDGRPLPNALIEIQLRAHIDCIGYILGPFHFDGTSAVRTGPDGTFQTPRELLRIADYRVEATAREYVNGGRDVWIDLAPGDVTAVPDLVLKKATRIRTVAGRVVDRRGAPVAGADVVAAGDSTRGAHARSDAEGRIRISGVVEGPAFLFVEKPGYRIAARKIGSGGEPVELVMDRSDEPPRVARKTVPWPISRAEERAIARKLLEPVLAATVERDPSHLREPVLAAMARVDPDCVLEMLENRIISGGQGLLEAAAVGRLEDSPREALKIVESDLDPVARIGGYLALFHAASSGQDDLRRDLLERSLAESRHIEEPQRKAALLARIGDAWLTLTDAGRAAPILRNARALVARVSRQQYPQGTQGLAPPLSEIDLASALAMIEGRDNTRFQSNLLLLQMELGEIAPRIAATNPAEAERLLGRLGPPSANNRDGSILRTCRNMAATELDRATRIAATMLRPRVYPQGDDRLTLELYARAAMAEAMASRERSAARQRLAETIAQLRGIAIEDQYRFQTPQAGCVIAGCLPLVERLDPDRLDEVLAMAIAGCPPRTDEPDFLPVRTLAILAAMVARYDPSAAEILARPIFEDLPDMAVPPFRNANSSSLAQVFAALSAVDPRRVAAIVERLPEDHDFIDTRFTSSSGMPHTWIDIKTQARVAVGRMLGLPIDGRRQEIGKLVIDPWLLGKSP